MRICLCIMSDSSYSHTPPITCTCCYDEITGTRDLKIYSHTHSLLRSQPSTNQLSFEHILKDLCQETFYFGGSADWDDQSLVPEIEDFDELSKQFHASMLELSRVTLRVHFNSEYIQLSRIAVACLLRMLCYA